MKIKFCNMMNNTKREFIIMDIKEKHTVEDVITHYITLIAIERTIEIPKDSRGNLLCVAMVNKRYEPLETVLKHNDEVVIMPLIAGG